MLLCLLMLLWSDFSILPILYAHCVLSCQSHQRGASMQPLCSGHNGRTAGRWDSDGLPGLQVPCMRRCSVLAWCKRAPWRISNTTRANCMVQTNSSVHDNLIQLDETKTGRALHKHQWGPLPARNAAQAPAMLSGELMLVQSA